MRCPQFTFRLALYFLLPLIAGTCGRADDAPILRIRADSWMPFNGDPAEKQPGYVVEFLREIFEPQGVKVDYQTMPWATALKGAATGEIDGVIGANKKEAEKLITGDIPVAEPQFALFARKGSAWRYENLRSLKDVRLGVIEGYSYWDSLDGYIKHSTPPAIKVYAGDAPLSEAMKDLAANRIDVVPESVLVFVWTAKNLGLKFADFRLAYTEPSEPLYVAFSKNEQGQKYAKLFDQGLAKLKKSGRYDAILSSYGLSPK